MLKIFLKAAILVFIILSVYFIVNPSACSNLMLGRVVHPETKETIVPQEPDTHKELLTPAGDKGKQTPSEQPGKEQQPDSKDAAPKDVPAGSTTAATAAYSQEDIDYAIASRYVELENEYAKKNKVNKESAKEISYQVMDDFELTPQEWESFLQRATQTNLFNQIRVEMSTKK